MNKKKTLAVGIPAYNEEANIGKLIKSIFEQKMDSIQLEKVYVLCDGCTDNTAKIARQLAKKHRELVVVDDGKRIGKPQRLNELFELSRSDFVVCIDADVVLENTQVFQELVKPLMHNDRVGLVWGRCLPIKPKSLAEKIAYFGITVFEDAIKGLDEKDKMKYRAIGRLRALPREFAEQFRFPSDIGSAEDVYHYLSAKKNGWLVKYQPKAIVYYQLPQSFIDYVKQMKRFIRTTKLHLSKNQDGKVMFESEVTWKMKMRALRKHAQKNPLSILVMYLGLQSLSHVLAIFHNDKAVWQTSRTTKNPNSSVLGKNSKKPKIVISSYDDMENPAYGGGGAYAVHEVAKRLGRNFDITVITGNYPNSRNKIKDGVYYKRIGTSFLGAKMGQVVYHLVLPFYVLKEKYDLWVESFTPPHSTSLLPLFTKKPVVGLAHMLGAEDMKRKYGLPFDLVENLGLKLYRYFIVLNRANKKRVQELNETAVVKVIPNGVYQPKDIDVVKENSILFLGRIEVDQKGLDLLLKAFTRVVKEEDIKLIIAGSGEKQEEERLKKLINRLNLRGKVKLLGRVEGEVKERLYRRSLLVVVPSRYETFSLVCLEAASYGLPIVCYDIDGLEWLPEGMIKKVKKFDVEELSGSILQLLKSKKERESLGDRARKFAGDYNWEKTTDLYKDFFTKIIKSDYKKSALHWEVSTKPETVKTRKYIKDE